MTDKELEKYFNEHNYHPKPYQLELAMLRYRHFGSDIWATILLTGSPSMGIMMKWGMVNLGP